MNKLKTTIKALGYGISLASSIGTGIIVKSAISNNVTPPASKGGKLFVYVASAAIASLTSTTTETHINQLTSDLINNIDEIQLTIKEYSGN